MYSSVSKLSHHAELGSIRQGAAISSRVGQN